MTEERKKMINAFKLYYSSDKSADDVSSKEYNAVVNCLFIFKRIKNGEEILNAVKEVYIKAGNGGGNVSGRIRRLAAETYVSDYTIYRYLQKATEIYIRELELIS